MRCYPSLGSMYLGLIYFNLGLQVLLGINHNYFIIV